MADSDLIAELVSETENGTVPGSVPETPPKPELKGFVDKEKDPCHMFFNTIKDSMPSGKGRCEFHPPGHPKNKCKCKAFVPSEVHATHAR